MRNVCDPAVIKRQERIEQFVRSGPRVQVAGDDLVP